MITLKPVNCCIACKSTPRNTALLTLELDLNKAQPACFTLRVSLISANSLSAISLLAWRELRTFSAASNLPLAASQRGLSGRLNTVKINTTAGIAITSSIIRQSPV